MEKRDRIMYIVRETKKKKTEDSEELSGWVFMG